MPISGSYYYPAVATIPFESKINSNVINNSSSFLGNSFSTVLGPVNIAVWSNFTVTAINNAPLAESGSLQSASIEVSPDSVNWEVLDNTTLAGLAVSGITSSQHSESSYRFLRVRAIPSGSADAGDYTGSLDMYLTLNNG